MHGQSENKELSSLYESVVEEGILSRAGARIAGAKAGAGQYFKNIGNTIVGNAAPVSAGAASRNAKVQSAYKSAAKGLLTDLQKLGLLPKGTIPTQATNQTVSTLANLVNQMNSQQTANSEQQPADVDVPANAPGQTALQAAAPAVKKVKKVAAPAAASAVKKAKAAPAAKKVKKAAVTDDKGFKPTGLGKSRKTYSNQSDEEFAFSSGLSFKKFFPWN